MRKLIALLLLTASAFGQELLRPTVDGSSGYVNAGCPTGTSVVSSSMALSHDAAGQATESTMGITGSNSAAFYSARIFRNWATTGNSYSALTLNVASSSNGYQSSDQAPGAACISYSLDSGGSWTRIRCDSGSGWINAIDTVTLSSSQDLSMIWVGACVQGAKGISSIGLGPGSDDVTISDIWTLGTTAPPHPPVVNAASSGQAFRNAVFVF